jgi:hypothetical protein
MSGLSITRYFPFARMKIIKQNVHHKDASSACIFIEPDRTTPGVAIRFAISADASPRKKPTGQFSPAAQA